MSVTSEFLLGGETYERGLRRALRCWKKHDETYERRIAELEAQVAALTEAAKAVVESEMDARRQQVTHWQNPTIDLLAALIQESE